MTSKKVLEWLTLDMAVFVVANILLIAYFRDALSTLSDLSSLELIVLGLAAFRAANIVSTEVITKTLRAPFVDETRKEGKTVEKPKASGFLGSVGHLLYCPSCTGVWLSTILVYCYAFWPVETFAVALFLALSAIERIVSVSLAHLRSR